MKYYRFPDTVLYKIGFPLFLFLVQILARSTAYANIAIGVERSYILTMGLCAVFGMAFVVYNKRELRGILTDRRMLAVVLVTVIVLVPMLVKRDWQMMYFSVLLCLYLPIFLSYFTTLKETARCYVLITAAFAAYSLIGLFLLKPLAQAGVLRANTFYSTGGWLMYDFGLTHSVILNNLGHPALRNFGIFREPGLYQVFLFVAVLLNNEWADWSKNWVRWALNAVLMVTLVTTFATGGVLALGLYFVFLFFDEGFYRKKWAVLGALAVCVAGIGIIAVALAQGGTWAYELVGMVEKVYNMSGSLTNRVDSIFENLSIFLRNPVFGERIATVLYAVEANTASTMILFSIFGLAGGILHLASWAALLWKKDRPLVGTLALAAITFITFNTQNTTHDVYFWLFPMLALTERGLPLLNFRKKR